VSTAQDPRLRRKRRRRRWSVNRQTSERGTHVISYYQSSVTNTYFSTTQASRHGTLRTLAEAPGQPTRPLVGWVLGGWMLKRNIISLSLPLHPKLKSSKCAPARVRTFGQSYLNQEFVSTTSGLQTRSHAQLQLCR
jgi:hypothetical protein